MKSETRAALYVVILYAIAYFTMVIFFVHNDTLIRSGDLNDTTFPAINKDYPLLKFFHLVQACLIFLVASLVWHASRLAANMPYLKTWTGFWVIILATYARKFFDFASSSTIVDMALMVASNIAVFLMGLQLLTTAKFKRSFISPLLFVTAASIAGQIVSRKISGMGQADPALVADASLAFSCMVFAGLRVSIHARANHLYHIRRFIWIPFFLYGLLQLVGPWQKDPRYGFFLFALALILKVACALVVVGVGIAEGFREIQKTRDELSKAVGRAEEAKCELESTVKELHAAQFKAEFKKDSYDAFSSLLIEATQLAPCFEKMLHLTVKQLPTVSGVLLIRGADTGDGAIYFPLAFRNTSKLCLPLTTQNPAVHSTQKSRVCHHNYLQWNSIISASNYERFEFDLKHAVGGIWAKILVFSDGTKLINDQVKILQEVLDAISFGIDAVLYLQQSSLAESIQKAFSNSDTLNGRLGEVARLAIEKTDSSSCIIVLQDSEYGRRIEIHEGQQFKQTEISDFFNIDSGKKADFSLKQEDFPQKAVFSVSESRLAARIKHIDGECVGHILCCDKKGCNENIIPFSVLDEKIITEIAGTLGAALDRERQIRGVEMFVRDSVHDLKKPVGDLLQILRYINKTITSPNIRVIRQRLQIAFDGVVQLLDIINNVDPNLNKFIPSSRHTYIFRDIVNPICRATEDAIVAEGIVRENIDWRRIDIGSLPPLMLDRSAIQRVVQNIVGNAVKYRNHDNSRFVVEFIGREYENEFALAIADYGIGVPEGWEDLIFEEGRRAPNVDRSKISGQGLGLSGSRQKMQEMGGTVRLSNRGNPTEFEIVFPRGARQWL